MRERKGEYFLKIVNEERYQQLFDHPEELRKIITYAKRLMQYEKCFDYFKLTQKKRKFAALV